MIYLYKTIIYAQIFNEIFQNHEIKFIQNILRVRLCLFIENMKIIFQNK